MAAVDNNNLAENTTFRSKVSDIMRDVAISIKGETQKVLKSAEMVAKRAILADKILWDSNRSVEYMVSKAIVSNGILTENSTDAEIKARIEEVFNGLAGVNDSDWGSDFKRIRYMAIYNQADSLTVQLLVNAGIYGVQPSKIANYKLAIESATDFNNLADLQTIINNT